jgi:D-beta-D-heptose 7-phosphate kinase / D-beta-D-heptose 1-phosphate adenosyltransferase
MTRRRVVVIGDALLDVDVIGVVERVAPDAPAPVVDQTSEQLRPGGAGLAATLAAEDGCEVVLVTAICADAMGQRLVELLAPRIQVVPIPTAGSTVVKRRIRANGQTLLRLDSGSQQPPDELPPTAIEALHSADAVLVSDYGRGVAGADHVRHVLHEVAARTPVVWDPHPRGRAPVLGTRLGTPNLAEAAKAMGAAMPGSVRAIGELADHLVARWHVGALAVTLGASGALLSYGQGAPTLIPAESVTVLDPCGAGDRFAAAAATTLAAGGITLEAVEAGVRSATAFVAAGGASSVGRPVDPARPVRSGVDIDTLLTLVRARNGTVVATGGCFDLLHAGHVATLHAARRLGDCLVVCLNSDASVRRLKGPGRPLVPAIDRARVLEALACVDAVVIFDEDTPVEALRRIRPDVWAKGGDYRGVDLPEQAVLHEWGGAAVVLPYLDGRSTTQLVRTAAGNISEYQEPYQEEDNG